MYNLSRLNNAFEARSYQSFTFPSFRSQLQVLASKSCTVAIAATDGIQPIGLILAEMQLDGKSAEVLSIFVTLSYRGQGIGKALLRRLELELQSLGCAYLKLVYVTGKPTTLVLEQLLETSHWSSPQPRMLVCKTTTELIVNAPWIWRKSLSSAYQIFPWQKITPAERLSIQQTQALSPWIPADLLPFQIEENLEPLNSLGLRYQGQVVGWIITHRITPETIRYSFAFIRQDLQKMGRLIYLIANAIQLQLNADNIPYGIFVVSCTRTPMVKFVGKHMAPYLTSIEETRESFKLLTQK